MKAWQKAILIVTVCVLAYALGHVNSNTDPLTVRPLLTGIGVLLVMWMKLSSLTDAPKG
jgi:hypothetical protein